METPDNCDETGEVDVTVISGCRACACACVMRNIKLDKTEGEGTMDHAAREQEQRQERSSLLLLCLTQRA